VTKSLLQHAASVVTCQQIDNITALFYVLNVSNNWLLFVDAFDELADKIAPFISNVRLCYSILFILSVNFIVTARTVAKILQIYRKGIFI